MKKTITFFALMCVAVITQAQTLTLKFNPQEDRTYTVHSLSNTDFTQNAMGTEVKVHNIADITNTYKLKGIEGENFIIEAQYVKLYTKTSSPMGEEEHGSELSTDISLTMKAMLNKTYILVVSPKGKVMEVREMDKILASLDADLGAMSKGKKKKALEVITAGFGNDMAKSMLQSCIFEYPNKELKAGHVWMTRDTSKNDKGNVLMDLQYKLLDFNDATVNVEMMGMAQTDPKNPALEMQGTMVKTQMAGSVSAKAVLDRSSAWIIEATATQDLSGGMDFSVNGQDMSFPIKTVSKTIIKTTF